MPQSDFRVVTFAIHHTTSERRQKAYKEEEEKPTKKNSAKPREAGTDSPLPWTGMTHFILNNSSLNCWHSALFSVLIATT